MARKTKEAAAITRAQVLDAAEHVFSERGVTGTSLAEIAAVVGADSGTVKSRLFRARERLRGRLDRYFRIGHETATVKRA